MKEDRFLVSPCIKVCRLIEGSNVCSGCFRTIQEITDWQDYKDREKLEVLNRIERRKESYLEYYNGKEKT
jgi:predicted Fe-S protein YdhL (DUF1289 family)